MKESCCFSHSVLKWFLLLKKLFLSTLTADELFIIQPPPEHVAVVTSLRMGCFACQEDTHNITSALFTSKWNWLAQLDSSTATCLWSRT